MAEAHEDSVSERHWSRYRRDRLVMAFLVIGWIPIGLAVSTIAESQRWTFLPFVFFPAWIGIAVFYGARLAVWPCPRCGKAFRGYMPLLPRRCRYCGQER